MALLPEFRIMISCHDRGGRETLLTTAETILCSLEATALAVWTLPRPHPASTRPSLSLHLVRRRGEFCLQILIMDNVILSNAENSRVQSLPSQKNLIHSHSTLAATLIIPKGVKFYPTSTQYKYQHNCHNNLWCHCFGRKRISNVVREAGGGGSQDN